jgi:hypothetical protein
VLLHRLPPFLLTLALFLGLCGGARLSDRALVTAGHPGERLARRIADAVRATVNGPLAAAIVVGAVMSAASVLTGVPHPMRFAMLAMALAMVPFGARAALATALLILLTHGGTWLGFEPASVAMSVRVCALSIARQYVVPLAGSLPNIAQSCETFLALSARVAIGNVAARRLIFRRLFRELNRSSAVLGEWFPSNQHWRLPCWRSRTVRFVLKAVLPHSIAAG